jgi:RimJ/RimL family protein N-acetyltransferase
MNQALPIGDRVEPVPAGRPFERQPLQGRSVSLVPLRADEQAAALYASFRDSDPEGRLWTYMGYGPFSGLPEFRGWLDEQQASDDPLFYAIVPARTGEPAGMASFMRMDLRNGVAEIGNIWLSPGLQKSRASSEAIFLMMRHVLETQGCRRLEWKCNALNAASRRAADRYGFTFEGIFRNHLIVKGRNRDTAWYSIIDTEWPRLRTAFESWLDDGNFGPDGTQITSLATLTAAARR